MNAKLAKATRRFFSMPRVANQRIEAAWAAQVERHSELAGATLVRERDEIGNGEGPDLAHRIYRALDGSYWLFVCADGERGFLSQLSVERAKNALRSSPDVYEREFGERTVSRRSDDEISKKIAMNQENEWTSGGKSQKTLGQALIFEPQTAPKTYE